MLFNALIAAVPIISSLFGVDQSNATKVITKAKEILGVPTDEELAERLKAGREEDIELLKLGLERYKAQLVALSKAAELETSLKLADVDDKSSARNREVALAGSGGNKLMYTLAGGTILTNIILLAVAFWNPAALNNPGIMALVGSHTSAMTLVLSYFFGSSVSSK